MDTSVLLAGVSGFRALPHNPSARFLQRWVERDTFTWLISEPILDEYKEVLTRHQVRRDLVGRIINLLREEATLVLSKRTERISPDPGDDPFCACAKQGAADFIVTLNPRDFPQEKLKARVIAPGEFFLP